MAFFISSNVVMGFFGFVKLKNSNDEITRVNKVVFIVLFCAGNEKMEAWLQKKHLPIDKCSFNNKCILNATVVIESTIFFSSAINVEFRKLLLPINQKLEL